MWNLKDKNIKQISEYNEKRNRLTDMVNKLVIITGERGGEGAR